VREACRRNGREYQQRFERGRPVSELESARLPRGAPARSGTRVRFLYDAAVFAAKCARRPRALAAGSCLSAYQPAWVLVCERKFEKQTTKFEISVLFLVKISVLRRWTS